ncbi:MAG: hypothetical protein WAO58_08000 [Fimbriimonadaceae bacterium]
MRRYHGVQLMARDMVQELSKQLGFLDRSCKLYDDGCTDEAVRIATVLRTLFHDTKQSTSLLTHLGWQDTMMKSTGHQMPFMTWPNLVMMRLNTGTGAEFVPILDEHPSDARLVPLKLWWQEELIFRGPPSGTILTRKTFALTAADKDGGAHVDTSLGPDYEYLRSQGSGWLARNQEGGVMMQLRNELPGETGAYRPSPAALAAIRQIGHEVLNTPAFIGVMS